MKSPDTLPSATLSEAPGKEAREGRTFRERLVAQFGKPSGFWGKVAGQVMAWRPSNRERNRWAIELLGIQRRDRVLEVGCGPGVALKWLSDLSAEGFVAGIDHSDEMVAQARRRNAKAIAEGRVYVLQRDVEELALLDPLVPFDKVLAVNVSMFWEEPVKVLRGLRRVLKPGGLIALVRQPRNPRATDETARQYGQEIAADLERAGYEDVHIELRPMKPVAAVGVTGRNPWG